MSINEDLVLRGFARARAYKPNIAHRAQLEQAQARAREGGLGLWGQCIESKGFGPRTRKADTVAQQLVSTPTAAGSAATATAARRPTCADFATWADADAYWERNKGNADAAKLDGNSDGIPCEKLKRRDTARGR